MWLSLVSHWSSRERPILMFFTCFSSDIMYLAGNHFCKSCRCFHFLGGVFLSSRQPVVSINSVRKTICWLLKPIQSFNQSNLTSTLHLFWHYYYFTLQVPLLLWANAAQTFQINLLSQKWSLKTWLRVMDDDSLTLQRLPL